MTFALSLLMAVMLSHAVTAGLRFYPPESGLLTTDAPLAGMALMLLVPIMARAAGAEPLIMVTSCLLGWALVALSLIDLRSFLLPDVLTLPLIPLGLLLSYLGLTGAPLDHALAASLGGGAVLVVNAIYRFLRDRDGIGIGDAKLLAVGGAWTGIEGLLSVLLIGCLAGLAMALACGALFGRSGQTAIPFGPALALGIWTTWLAGPILAPVW